MKTVKLLTLASVAATLLFQTFVARADGNEKKDDDQQINKGFLTLAAGIYKKVDVGDGPEDNLGLSQVKLNGGNYFKVNIYPIRGLPGHKDQDKAIGTFYVSIVDQLCAYDLPGGSFSAKFLRHDIIMPTWPDGSATMDGTFELEILETTGNYQPLAGGHIHMVGILTFRADGTMLEDCFCHVHLQPVAP